MKCRALTFFVCAALGALPAVAVAEDAKSVDQVPNEDALATGSVYISAVASGDDALKKISDEVIGALASEIEKLEGHPVATNKDVASISTCGLAQSEKNDEDRIECVSNIGQVTNARYIASTTVGQVGRDYLVTLTLIDTEDARSVGREAITADSVETIRQALGDTVLRLFGRAPQATSGRYQLPTSKDITKFGVFGIESSGIAEQDVKNLGQFLCVELSKLDGAQVIAPDDIEAILGKQGIDEALGCGEGSEKCLANIAGSLNVDYIVAGQVGSLTSRTAGDAADGEEVSQPLSEYVVSLKLIDQKAVKVVSRKAMAFRGPKEELKRAIRTLARQLVGVSGEQNGTIAVSGPVTGAQVFVGEQNIGALPIKPESPFPAGRMNIRLEKEGYYPWESDVFVQPGEENLIWAQLEERPSPWFTKWWVWTLVGVAVAGGATAAVLVLNDPPETGQVDANVFGN